MYRWLSLLSGFVALTHFIPFCAANPNPLPLVGSNTLEKPVTDNRRKAEDRTTIEDIGDGTGGGGGGGGRGGNTGGGGGGRGGGGDDDDEDESDGLIANRAEVRAMFARLIDGSNDAYHYFLIDEYNNDNPTVDFGDWRVRQSLCVKGLSRNMNTPLQDEPIPCITTLEYPTIGGTPTLDDLEEIDRRMREINRYSENEYLQFIEYTMHLEYISFDSGRNFSFRVNSGNGVTSNEMTATEVEFYCEGSSRPTGDICVWTPDTNKRNISPYEWIEARPWQP